MRFFPVPSTPFTRFINPDLQRDLKDKIVVGDQDTFTSRERRDIYGNIQLDSMASKVYGGGNEWQWFVIGNRNIREIIGWKADFTYILKVDIPDPTEYSR